MLRHRSRFLALVRVKYPSRLAGCKATAWLYFPSKRAPFNDRVDCYTKSTPEAVGFISVLCWA